MRPDQMTAAELELVVALELEKVGGDRGALEELGRRARAVELLEDDLVMLGQAIRRTKSEGTRRALERVDGLVRQASPTRRRILRGMGLEEVERTG